MDADRYAEAFQLNLALPTNVTAYLGAVSFSEGTEGPDGWRALYGWRKGRDDLLFTDMSVHPRRRFWIKTGAEVEPGETFGPNDTTTAAGKPQINWPTWSNFMSAEGAMPFDQLGQTKCFVWLLKRAGAYDDIVAGNFEAACAKCASTWASLPQSLAGQHPKTMDAVRTAYLNSGGALA